MSTTRIKICGLYQWWDIRAVNEVLPEYAGFVFYPPSHRNVTRTQAVMLGSLLDLRIKRVGVFVNEPVKNVIQLLKDRVIDLAQLHGQETEEQIHQIRQETGCEVIKAVKVRTSEDIARWQQSEADFLLYDNGKGTGQTFDWSLLKESEKSFFLAGGITEELIPEVIARFHPFCIDMSSGVETDGKKDADKIKRAVNCCRKVLI